MKSQTRLFIIVTIFCQRRTTNIMPHLIQILFVGQTILQSLQSNLLVNRTRILFDVQQRFFREVRFHVKRKYYLQNRRTNNKILINLCINIRFISITQSQQNNRSGEMNKMTSKQYLVDITLVSLDIGRQSKAVSKVLCQIHYGDGDTYLKIKLQPLVKNGIALFYEQRLRIPYSSEIALVFKMFKSKKQIFLGHYTIQLQKYLQQKVFSAKLKQKLEQTDAWVDFQVKIIDKQLFCDEESDDLQDQDLFPTTKSQYSQQQKSKANYSDYKAKSDINTPFVIIKKQQQLRPALLPEQFSKLLLNVEDILKKHKINQAKLQLLQEQQDQEHKKKQAKSINSSTIMRLQNHIQQAKKNQQINNYILWLCVALLGLFIGIALKS